MKEISPVLFFKRYQTTIHLKIIDVRDINEFEKYHIPDAINIPVKLLYEKHYLFLNKNRQYFIICKNGTNSHPISEYLDHIGYQVTNVIGGMDRWPGIIMKGKI